MFGLGAAPLTFAELLGIVRVATRAVGEGKQLAESVAQLEQMTATRALGRGHHGLGATRIASNSAHTEPL